MTVSETNKERKYLGRAYGEEITGTDECLMADPNTSWATQKELAILNSRLRRSEVAPPDFDVTNINHSWRVLGRLSWVTYLSNEVTRAMTDGRLSM